MLRGIALPENWVKFLEGECDPESYLLPLERSREDRKTGTVFPPEDKVFNAFELTPPESVRVVIVGQDPYHQPGQAQGLAFSVPDSIKPPPSLRNIIKEIFADTGIDNTGKNDLTSWARQGVLLINTALTVRENSPASHKTLGWESFIDAVISALSHKREHIVYLLWGSHAALKEPLINGAKNLILKAAHPSPLSAYRGFSGCGHFSAVNRYCSETGSAPINWKL